MRFQQFETIGFSFLLGLLIYPAISSASPITITDSEIWSRINNLQAGLVKDESTEYGSRAILFTEHEGTSEAFTEINWSDSDTGAVLDFDFGHYLVGPTNQSFVMAASQGSIYFTANEATSYSLSGFYESEMALRLYNRTFLQDLTTGEYLFLDNSDSRSTEIESFVLGDANDADYANETLGNLEGMLIEGHEYWFTFTNWLGVEVNPPPSTATGCLTLILGDAGTTNGGACGIESVPEPSTLLILMLGLLTISAPHLAFTKKHSNAKNQGAQFAIDGTFVGIFKRTISTY